MKKNFLVTAFFDRHDRIGEITCFLRRVVLQTGNSLLTGAESRVPLQAANKAIGLPFS